MLIHKNGRIFNTDLMSAAYYSPAVEDAPARLEVYLPDPQNYMSWEGEAAEAVWDAIKKEAYFA